MKHIREEKSAWFFRLAFLMFSFLVVLSAGIVCSWNALHTEGETFVGFLLYTALYFLVTWLFYRFFAEKKWSIIPSVILCFGVRAIFVSFIKIQPFSDFSLYDNMAKLLLKGESLCSDYGSMFPHTLGYSYILSRIYRIFGENPYAMQLCNAFLDTLTALVLFLCSHKLFHRKIANLTVFFYAISPSFVMYSELLATEMLFGLLLSVLTYLAICFYEKPRLILGILFGGITGLLNGIRPCGILVLFAFFLYVVLIVSEKKRLLALLLAILCYVGVWNGVFMGLEQLNGQPIASAPIGYNLCVGSNSQYNGLWNATDYDNAMNLAEKEEISPDEVHAHMQTVGLNRFYENGFMGNLKLVTMKFGILWGGEMLACDYMMKDATFQVLDKVIQTENLANAFHLLLVLGMLFGAFQLFRQKRRDGVIYICILVMGITAQHLIAEVQERYAYPALLSLMPVAALGLSAIFEKGRSHLFKRLREDIRAVMEKDPAAKNVIEVFLLSPGIHALFWHRAAHRLYRWKLFFLARWISQTVRLFTGIEIHPGAKIGHGVMIDHGMGVVIGETAEVGDGCTIYQNVTLGGTGKDTGKRHPTIGKNVMIGSGAKVLGPFTVGDNSKIAANAVVLREVPENSTCVGVPARIVVRNNIRVASADWQMDQTHIPDPVAQELCRMLARIEKIEAGQNQEIKGE